MGEHDKIKDVKTIEIEVIWVILGGVSFFCGGGESSNFYYTYLNFRYILISRIIKIGFSDG